MVEREDDSAGTDLIVLDLDIFVFSTGCVELPFKAFIALVETGDKVRSATSVVVFDLDIFRTPATNLVNILTWYRGKVLDNTSWKNGCSKESLGSRLRLPLLSTWEEEKSNLPDWALRLCTMRVSLKIRFERSESSKGSSLMSPCVHHSLSLSLIVLNASMHNNNNNRRSNLCCDTLNLAANDFR